MEAFKVTATIPMSDDQFRLLRDFIYEKSGIYFASDKKDFLGSRLSRRMNENNVTDYDKYYYLLKYDPRAAKESRALFDSITTSETSFFRSPPQIQAFQKIVLPSVIENRPKKGRMVLRLWSGGCSTGEEPYTMGIVVMEVFKDELSKWDIKIFASDISEKALETARAGVYNKYALRGVSPDIKTKYFIYEGGTYKVKDEIRHLIEFKYLNLNNAEQMRLMRGFDIIFCRNVLAAFDDVAKKRVVSQFYDSLNYGGYLFIGHAESLHNLSRAFKLVHFPGALGYKKE